MIPDSRLVRILGGAYSLLLYSYPREFRRRYGAEMRQLFDDRCRALAQTPGVLRWPRFILHTAADWLGTTFQERIAALSSAPAAQAVRPAADGVPIFYTCGSEVPRRFALLHGVLLSVGVFALISFLIGQGGSRPAWLFGSHHPSRSHLLPAAATASPVDLDSEVNVRPFPDEPPVSPYFRIILVLRALDADRDGVISAAEIANAARALRTLDHNSDGTLEAEECGLQTGHSTESNRRLFMQFHPVLAALDANRDGVISSAEIDNAPAALRTLDRNRDGRLTIDELLPGPVKRSR